MTVIAIIDPRSMQPADWLKIPIPQNYADLYAHYGDPSRPDFVTRYIVPYTLPLATGGSQRIQTHRAMVIHLDAIVRKAGQDINTCAGSYNYRAVRGGTHLSLHSWGLAIDINADEFPLGSDKKQALPLLQAFADSGYWWGGDYHHRKDPMHWQYAGDF